MTKKLDSFNGTGFADWKFKLQMAMQSFSSEAHQFLGWAENLGAEIDSDVDITDDQKPLCERLYFVLAQMTTGEAFDLVRNAPELNGAEAWRRLCKRYGGKTTGKRVHLTRRCVNPPKVKKLAEALSMVEKWESCVRRLSVDYKETMSDGLKSGILLEMMPGEVTEIMMQRIDEHDSYTEVKDSLMRYVETKQDFGGQAPMDVGTLQGPQRETPGGGPRHDHASCEHACDGQYPGQPEELHVMGKGGGKGGKGEFSGYCNKCGEWGHRARECPQQEVCYYCGAAGHRVAQCPAKDADMRAKGGQPKGKGWNKGEGYKGGWSKGGPSYSSPWKGGGGKNQGQWGKGWGKGPGKGWSSNGTYGLWSEEPDNNAWALPLFGLALDAPPAMKDFHPVPKPGMPQRFTAEWRPLQVQNRFSALCTLEEQEEVDVEEPDEVPLAALFDPELELLHIPESTEWVKIESVVDSGAAESVQPANMVPWVPMVESEGSRRGQTYTSAGGERLPNLGEKKLSVLTPDGRPASARYQCADVTRALSAVSQMCDQGNRVVFEQHGGYLENLHDGTQTHFKRVNNVYIMELYVEKPCEAAEAGFTWPSQR